jgi:pyruvate/2-oxoglutarate dehydrogenase complex dihydrolipoamide dehydrogenase (E3) component
MSGLAESLYDVIVIGTGPIGQTVADRARVAGLSVAAVERELVGGECSYWACIPSKDMLRPVVAVADARRDGYVTDWNDEGRAGWLKSIGAELIRGHGRLDGYRLRHHAGPAGHRRRRRGRGRDGQRLGSSVTLPAQADGLLPRMEAFAGELVGQALAEAGVDVRIGATVTAVRRPDRAGPVTVTPEEGGEVEADSAKSGSACSKPTGTEPGLLKESR